MKQMKVLSVFGMLAMTLGLAACGGGTKECANNKHTWGKWEEVTPATCTVDGTQKRVCEKCGKEETKAIKAGHKWGDWQDVKVATCQEKGSQKRVCSVCNAEETRETDLADHSWGEWETVTEADCTNPGSRKHKCSVCEQEETETVDALGHDWGEWEELVAPTCTEKGSHKHKCQRCQLEETEDVPALGHDYQLIGDDTEPDAGKAKVRVYTCANGCGSTLLGFKANEVSEESRGHLSFKESQTADGKTEIGASFWGRPIGNALALKADGSSVAEKVDECVYCSAETGDFFEYIFDLTPEQVTESGLDECRLYLDAKPADYMNGGDFFAYRGGNTDDWTPGYYIDGGEDHIEKNEDGTPVMVKDHARSVRGEDGAEAEGVELETEVPMGKRITDYRYILYVDDEVQTLEAGVSNPTHGQNANMTREEFILPFVFHLHAGTNKIRLGMAGGYRSTFYNFTFRPVEEEQVPPEPQHEHTWVEETAPVGGENDAIVKKFKCSDEECGEIKYEMDVKDAKMQLAEGSAWKNDPKNGTFKLNKDGHSASFSFKLDGEFEGKLYQEAYMDSYKNNYTKKLYYETDNVANIEVKLNDSAIDLSQFAETKFEDVFGDGTGLTNSEVKNVEIGDVKLGLSNTLSYKRVKTLNMIVSKFVLIGKVTPHVHSYVYGSEKVQKEGECDYVVGECAADGFKALKIDAGQDLNGKITARGKKLPKGSSGKYDGTAIASYKFTAPAGFPSKAHLLAVATPDNAGNFDYSYYTGKDSSGKTQTVMPDGSTNTVLKINGNDITMPTATYGEMGCTTIQESGAGLIDFGEFNLVEGTNEFTLAATNSYGLLYFDFIIAA